MAIRRKPRRGVLLLLVLSLLVLFALIGTTFIIVAGRYDENSRRYSDLDRVGTDPAEQLNSVMMDLLRGPSGRSSILTDENLLRDLYGDDRIEGRVANSVFEANGQFIRMVSLCGLAVGTVGDGTLGCENCGLYPSGWCIVGTGLAYQGFGRGQP